MVRRYSKAKPTATQPPKPQRSSSASIKRVRASDPRPMPATDADVRRYCGIPYVDRYQYFDTVKYLGKTEISEAARAWLRAHCRRLDIRPHGKMLFPPNGEPYQINIHPWRFRIEIHGPDRAALAFFAELPNIKVTAAHIARDFTFDDAAGKSALLDLFEMHWVQRWQRKSKRISFDNGGLSTGRRRKGHYETVYISRPCRIDGIVDCFHGEGRYLGTKGLAQIGICSASDLPGFDFTEYHAEKDRNCLMAIDKRRLGRYARNRMQKTRDQQAHDSDLRLGGLIWRIYSLDQFGNRSVEQFIRSYPAARSAKNIIGTVDTGRAQP